MTNFKALALGASALALSMATPASAASLILGFEGSDQLAACALNACFRPPDTMGAVGTTQYMELNNGIFRVHDKATGANLFSSNPSAFWTTQVGLGNTGGDPRVMFDAASSRWIAIAFGSTNNVINVGVSATSDALGVWRGMSIPVLAAGNTADYPTLALDRDAIYIGTNNFSTTFFGTSLLVLNKANVFAAAGPTTTGMTTFTSPNSGPLDNGFAIQGVNSSDLDGVGRIVADSRLADATVAYNINNPGTAGATQTVGTQIPGTAYAVAPLGRQPDGTRTVDTLSPRITGSVHEMNGKIYYAHTVAASVGLAAAVRVVVLDAVTKAVLSITNIEDPNFDFFQGSLAINSAGKLVVGYNRSGAQTTDLNSDGKADGNISVMARVYNANANGTISQTDEILIRVSDTGDYHCTTTTTTPCRERWGDYAAVSLDPSNNDNFWVIGEYAQVSAIIPGFTTTPRSIWGTYIGVIGTSNAVAAVPEPASWMMMLAGFGLVGGAIRRKRVTNVTYSVA
jgi:PEP-CTERM motif